jgi:ribosomal protein S18 acetylase RimI-like enzyme
VDHPIRIPRVRPAQLADAPQLAWVESRAWRTAYGELLPDWVLAGLAPERLARVWRDRLVRSGASLVVDDGAGRLLGYVTFGRARGLELDPGFAGELYELYVDPTVQRSGVGKALFAAASTELARRYAWLVVEVLAGNHRARAFYTSMGLATDGREWPRPLGPSRSPDRTPAPHTLVVRYEGPLVDLTW